MAVAAVAVAATTAAAQETTYDLRTGVPSDTHLAVYAQKNAERDYQNAYLAEVWQTIQDEKICDRIYNLVTSRMPEDKLEELQAIWDEVAEAAAPMDSDLFFNAEQFVYAQRMEAVFTHHLFMMQIDSSGADAVQQAFVQLADLLEEKSGGEITFIRESDQEAKVLVLPTDAPSEMGMRPTAIRLGNVVLLSTNEDLARQSAEMLQSQSGPSKFDDPRFQQALERLPEPEDALVIFDGKLMFEKLRGIGDFIKAESGGKEEAATWANVMQAAIDEFAILDYEVTVEYTEGETNRTAAYGKLTEESEGRLLRKAVSQGEPFADWQKWVPADAEAFSLSAGVNLHAIYEGVLEFVKREIPQASGELEKWEAIQEQIGVHVDRDILQSFSGESVSVTLPVEAPDGSTTQHSVTALKCTNPEGIRELLHRAFDGVSQVPALQAQQVKLVACEDFEGFEQVQAMTLAMFGVQPVIGFHNGWMMIASDRGAAERVVAVLDGEADSISGAASLERFELDVDGEVYAVKYTDIGAGVRQAAQTVEQISAMAPVILGMAAANADPEDLKPIQEVIELLPSVAKVIRKFDFMERSLSVTTAGPEADSYMTRSAMILRQPAAK